MPVVVQERLGPLELVVIPKTKVGPKEKATITAKGRVKYTATIWGCNNELPVTGDGSKQTI
jgi:hypothetical protein